jgi:general secretion pathway protein D
MRYAIVLCVILTLFTGCATKQTTSSATVGANDDFQTFIENLPQNGAVANYLHKGVEQLQKKDFSKAAQIFKEGLRLYPAQSNLHFFHALSYHLQASSRDAKYLEMAKSGYKTALKFDAHNFWAAYFLGHIYFEQKNYVQAQNRFSYTLLYAPNNVTLLRALAAASYYANDPVMSLWAAKQAYSKQPDNLNGLQTLVFAYAASGDIENAKKYLSRFQTLASAKQKDALHARFAKEIMNERIGSWQVFYAASNDSIYGDSKEFEQTYIPKGAFSDTSYNPATDEKPLAQTLNDTNTSVSTQSDGLKIPKMVLVDVVIIGTEEVRSQSKGINILEGLQTTLSGTLYGYTRIRGDNAIKSISYSPSFNLMDLEYNLNIFNDANNKAEVLAKPSLLATENQPSKFYSGAVLHVQLSSNNADGSMVDVPIGIHLDVTPSFYDDDIVALTVHAERNFLQSLSEHVGFNAYTQTTSVSVDATATLKFGQTLMLSGLSEVSDTKTKSGVPLLQNIPGVQYFFSQDEESQVKKSILILLTPRKARYLDQDDTNVQQDTQNDLEDSKYTKDLQKSCRITIPSNFDTVLADLQNNGLFRQFQAGDVQLESWDDIQTLENAFKRNLKFLYY